jgi:hypothetical protein
MFRLPCKHCIAQIAASVEKEPLISMNEGFVNLHCPHEKLAVCLTVERGFILDWSIWPADDMEAIRKRFARATRDTLAGAMAEKAEVPGPVH